jgi:hypothetical protein
MQINMFFLILNLPSTSKKKPFGLVLNNSIAFSVISTIEGCNAGFLSKISKKL